MNSTLEDHYLTIYGAAISTVALAIAIGLGWSTIVGWTRGFRDWKSSRNRTAAKRRIILLKARLDSVRHYAESQNGAHFVMDTFVMISLQVFIGTFAVLLATTDPKSTNFTDFLPWLILFPEEIITLEIVRRTFMFVPRNAEKEAVRIQRSIDKLMRRYAG